ncbi:MAG: hypothetical protein DVB31_07040 [Verrucomicrobia bacterium]|nr:MAG: hypothetical protein DVB31_07040 [Verrucomicrobiota bacterium]
MQFVTVAQYLNQTEADLVAAELRAAGFEVYLHSEFSAPATGLTLFRVQVSEDRAEEARAFLKAEEADDAAGKA